MCRRNLPIKFLLVIFNKSVERNSNVMVKTAYKSYKFITETAGYDRFKHYGLKYTDLIHLNYIPISHRAAMIMETLTMFYNSEEKEVGIRPCS